MVLPMPDSSNQRHHETRLMIFISTPAGVPAAEHGPGTMGQ